MVSIVKGFSFTFVVGSIRLTPFLLIAIRSNSGRFGSVVCYETRIKAVKNITGRLIFYSVIDSYDFVCRKKITLTSKKADPKVGHLKMILRNMNLASSWLFPACWLKYVTIDCREKELSKRIIHVFSRK